MLAWSAAAVGAFLFTTAVICLRKNKLPRATSWLMLLAGAGLSGLLGGVVGWVTGTIGRIGGAATNLAFGVGVSAVLGFAVVCILAIDMHPKKGRPTRLTPWLALLAVPLVVATFGGAMAQLPDAINNGVVAAGNALSRAIADLIQGL